MASLDIFEVIGVLLKSVEEIKHRKLELKTNCSVERSSEQKLLNFKMIIFLYEELLKQSMPYRDEALALQMHPTDASMSDIIGATANAFDTIEKEVTKLTKEIKNVIYRCKEQDDERIRMITKLFV